MLASSGLKFTGAMKAELADPPDFFSRFLGYFLHCFLGAAF
jgi:hypothetical protein